MKKKKVLIIGVGNPIRGDDSAGLEVVKILKSHKLPGGIETREASTGGLPLVEQFLDFEKVYLIDATYDLPGGEVKTFNSAKIKEQGDSTGVHGMGLTKSLKGLRRIYPDRVPKDENIKIFGIGINKNEEFSEKLSEQVAKAVDQTVKMIHTELGLSGAENDH